MNDDFAIDVRQAQRFMWDSWCRSIDCAHKQDPAAMAELLKVGMALLVRTPVQKAAGGETGSR